MKKTFTHAILILCLMGFIPLMAQNNNRQITSFAQQKVELWLNKIPEGKESAYGFNSRDEFKIGQAGNPIQMMGISPSFLKGESTDPFFMYEEYRVPVMVNNEYRTFITVINHQENMEVVDLGGNILAIEIQSFSTESQKNYLLRIHQWHMDFLVVEGQLSNLTDATFMPLEMAKNQLLELGLKSLPKYNHNEFIDLIKALQTRKN